LGNYWAIASRSEAASPCDATRLRLEVIAPPIDSPPRPPCRTGPAALAPRPDADSRDKKTARPRRRESACASTRHGKAFHTGAPPTLNARRRCDAQARLGRGPARESAPRPPLNSLPAFVMTDGHRAA